MENLPFECPRCDSLAVVPLDVTCTGHPWHGRCQVCGIVLVEQPARESSDLGS
jgi:transcription elongation factor Elf1